MKTKAGRSFETSGINNACSQCYILGDLTVQHQSCRGLKSLAVFINASVYLAVSDRVASIMVSSGRRKLGLGPGDQWSVPPVP